MERRPRCCGFCVKRLLAQIIHTKSNVATDFHSKGGEVQGDVWELICVARIRPTLRSKMRQEWGDRVSNLPYGYGTARSSQQSKSNLGRGARLSYGQLGLRSPGRTGFYPSLRRYSRNDQSAPNAKPAPSADHRESHLVQIQEHKLRPFVRSSFASG
jgi:hypothetical protein